jgi:FO synthase
MRQQSALALAGLRFGLSAPVLSDPSETDRLSGELEPPSLAVLMERARGLRTAGHGTRVSFSPKVFIPLTRLCRDVCGYCTFAKTPREMEKPFLSPDDVLKIARDGVKAGCSEALFTLGELPELRYAAARAPQLLRPARATWTFA